MRPLLLDTCVAIWLSEGEPLRGDADAALDTAHERGQRTLVSPITAWEIGMLVSLGRLRIQMTPQNWFARVLAFPGMALADLSPEMFIASSFLPGKPPRDPADRIIAATARHIGATLITRDSVLLGYAKQGHLNAIAS